jgi:hypothetical protein
MKLLLTSCLLLTFLSCKDKVASPAEEPAPAEKAAPAEQSNIFPVYSFFTEQIRDVDSLRLPTVKYSSTGAMKDTAAISLEEFKQLANEFLESDISNPSLRQDYKETSFADQSIPSVTFTYSATNSSLPVKRMDVLLDPSPVADDKVKTVYIEKQQVIKDTVIVKKLYWRSHKNFQIVTSKQVVGKPEVVSHVKVAWDNSDGF